MDLAYTQLRLARRLVEDQRRPWERKPVVPARLSPVRIRNGFRAVRPATVLRNSAGLVPGVPSDHAMCIAPSLTTPARLGKRTPKVKCSYVYGATPNDAVLVGHGELDHRPDHPRRTATVAQGLFEEFVHEQVSELSLDHDVVVSLARRAGVARPPFGLRHPFGRSQIVIARPRGVDLLGMLGNRQTTTRVYLHGAGDVESGRWFIQRQRQRGGDVWITAAPATAQALAARLYDTCRALTSGR